MQLRPEHRVLDRLVGRWEARSQWEIVAGSGCLPEAQWLAERCAGGSNEAVAEVAVIGLPHDELGEEVGAAVALKEGQEADERAGEQRRTDLPGLPPVADQHGIPVLEDTAQAVGCTLAGKHVGTTGACGTYSFDAVKTLTTGDQVRIEKSMYVSLCRMHWEEETNRWPVASASPVRLRGC